MRARLSAFLMLVLVMAIPGGVYWYFFVKNTASLTLSIGEDIIFQAVLDGNIESESVPLADTLIHIERTCQGECRIEPIAPIRYTLSITSTGKTSVTDTLDIGVGEDATRTYRLYDDITIIPMDEVLVGNESIGVAMIANARKKDASYEYILTGVDGSGTVYAEKHGKNLRELGTLTLDGFNSRWKIPEGVGIFSLDITGEYFIATLYADKTILISRDFTQIYELPLRGVISYMPGIEQKILTKSGVLLSMHSSYGENPRFTDWIDISDTMRIGYISREDTMRLELSGQDIGNSVLLLYNRDTHEASILRTGLDITWMFTHDNIPVFLDREGKLWEIQYKK